MVAVERLLELSLREAEGDEAILSPSNVGEKIAASFALLTPRNDRYEYLAISISIMYDFYPLVQ